VAAGADAAVALVAAGHSLPDALAAGPAAAALGGVLLLTDRSALVPATRSWVEARAGGFEWLRVAGGPAAVDDLAVGQLLEAATS
jgi:hypothetical protein